LSHEQHGYGGNYGISDQQLALEWVQRNARAFGGDPTRVTLAGQSSGGTSINALLSSPRSKGLFFAAIAWSGSPNLSMNLKDAVKQNQAVVDGLGCNYGHHQSIR
jgi:para-nitrobenzyl esterase